MDILILCSYPIKNPLHGGQLRVRNIVDFYRAAGHDVRVVGVLGSEAYEQEEGFSRFPRREILSDIVKPLDLMEDYALGRLFAENDRFFWQLASKIENTPSIIHVEQPWLFDFAMQYKKSSAPDARIIYGSQNIEWKLKKDILSTSYDENTASRLSQLIEQTETKAIENADGIICVSVADATWTSMTAKCPVVVAPNGVNALESTSFGRLEAEVFTADYKNYALYCGSAHPPNITGFFDIFGGGFGCLMPDERLIIAGSAGTNIINDNRIHSSAKLSDHVIATGTVSRECLAALLERAQCIVIPITQGGGTNLKTAEALWSGKYIVATNLAMRGFEDFINTPGIFVSDTPSIFKNNIRHVMSLPPLELSPEEAESRRTVLWENCLQPLESLLKQLTIDV